MATFVKRATGWQAKIRKRGFPPQSQTFRTKAMAQRWASEVEADMERGVFKDSRNADTTPFADLLQRYVEEVLPTIKHTRAYAFAAQQMSSFFTHDAAGNVDADRVLAYVRHRAEQGVSLSTVKKDLQVIAKIAAVAPALWGLNLDNPVPQVLARIRLLRLFDAETARERRVSPDEYARLSAWRPTKRTVIRELALFVIETAMRRGEVCALQWQDVDLHNQTLVIRESKTDAATGVKGRTIALSTRAVQLLEDLPGGRAGSVFAMRPDSVTQAFERMCTACGIEGLRFHDLRHEATSRLFERGLGIQEVASITGHADWSALKRYTHPRAQDVAKKLG